MKKVIVFDLDGTLLNTLDDLTDSVNFALTTLALPTYTNYEVSQMIGNGVPMLMKRALRLRQDLHPQAVALQRQYYRDHFADKTRPYQGILPLLKELKAQGFIVVVHTNKNHTVAEQLCNKLLLEIDVLLGTQIGGVTKPDAQSLLQLLKDIGAQKCVYCGDSDIDINTAKNAGVPCISVTWGFRNRQFLLEHGAQNLADTPQDVLPLIQTLTK